MIGRPRTVSDQAILAAVGRAIGRYGPTRLTLAHVAAEAGLAPATLLQRFGSKRGMLLAFAASGASAIPATFARAREISASPLADLIAALVSMAAGVSTPEELSNHLALLSVDLTDPDFLVHARTHTAIVQNEVRALLAAAVVAGELPDCDVDRLARAMKAVYDGALIGWAIEREGHISDWVLQNLETVLEPWRLDR